jgi:hypothetical protein
VTGGGEVPPSTDAGSGVPAPPPDSGDSEKKMPPPPTDGGSSDPAPPEPADGGSTSTDATKPPPPGCPQDKGVCLADPPKVPVQPGCKDFCAAIVNCDKLFGNGSGSSGGSSGSGSADAGSAGSAPKSSDGGSAGFAPKPPADAGSGEEDQAPPDQDAGLWVSDTVSTETTNGPDPGAMGQCILLCSIWKLEAVAATELKALEMCVAANKATCQKLDAECTDKAKTFVAEAQKDDTWALALGIPVASGGNSTDPPKGGDAGTIGIDAQGGNPDSQQQASPDGGTRSDTGTNTGGTADAGATDTSVKADSGAAAGNATPAATPASSSGCTAAPSPRAGLGFGLLFALLALVLRRRALV